MVTKNQKITLLQKELKWLVKSLENPPPEARKQYNSEKEIFEAILNDYVKNGI